MNTWARKSFKVGVLSAGALLFAGTAANAATFNSAGNTGFLNGNQVGANVQAPIDVCGNAVGVLGFAQAACVGGSWATLGDDNTTLNSVGNSGLGNGNQIDAKVQAPIDVCGNAVGVAGAAFAACHGGSWATMGGGTSGGSSGGNAYTAVKAHHKKANTESTPVTESTTLTSVGNVGAGNGNQANAVIQIPIDVCGNAVGVLGAAQASCVGGATATDNGGSDTTMTSGFNAGLLNGNQANALVQIPINVCGNAVGVLGAAQASCVGGSTATTGGGGGGGGGNGGGNGGGSGYGTGAAIAHHVGAHRFGAKENAMANTEADDSACSPTLNSLGNLGLLNGNQLNLVAQVPVEISGNAVGVLGFAQASSVGGAWATC
jgi:hypothetical protein